MVLGLLDLLQILSQLYLIEFTGFPAILGLLKLWYLIYARLLTVFGMLVFFTNLKSYRISGHMFDLISSFLSNRPLQVVLDGKSSQEYPVNVVIPQGSILGPTLFLLYIIDLPDDVICDIAIYADDTTLYSKGDQAPVIWQQLELASELKPDLRDTVDRDRKWLVDFNVGKLSWFSSIDVKMDGSVLKEKPSFKMLGLTFSAKLDWGFYIISIAKTASKKIGALICSMRFLSPEVALCLFKSTICPCMKDCCHGWAGAPSCYLELLEEQQKRICRTVGPSLAASLIASLSKCGQLKTFL